MIQRAAELTERVTIALKLLVACIVVIAAMQLVVDQALPALVLLTQALHIGVITLGLLVIRRAGTERRVLLASLVLFCATATSIAVVGHLSNDPTTAVIALMASILGTATFVPWGARLQGAASIATFAGFAWMLYSVDVSFDVFLRMAGTIVPILGASVLIAHFLARSSQTLRGANAVRHAVFAHAPVGLVLTTPEGIATDVNRAQCRLLGKTQQLLIGTNVQDWLPEHDAEKLSELLTAVGASGDDSEKLQARLTTQTRNTVMVDIVVTRLPTIDGAGLLIVFEDMTVVRATEATLHQATQAAEATAQAKMDFLATMSHEIRTPMNGVIGLAGILLDSPLSEQQREHALAIRKSGDSLLRIIDEILDYSKLDANAMTLEVASFSLIEAVEDVIELCAPLAEEKGLSLCLIVASTVPPRVEGDVGRLRQILLNVVNNAIKFTDAGKVVVRLDGKRNTPLRFTITDTGIGMSEAARTQLFRRFRQADESITRRFGGTGLGLAIVDRLVRLMDGTIDVQSQLGRGTSVSVIVDLPSKPSHDSGFVKELQGQCVLVVAPPSPERDSLVSTLERLSIAPCTATTAEDVTKQCQPDSQHPVAIISAASDLPDAEWRRIAQVAASEKIPHLVVVASDWELTALASLPVAGAIIRPVRASVLAELLVKASSQLSASTTPQPNSPRPAAVARMTTVRILVAEDDVINQMVTKQLLRNLGYEADVVSSGKEAVEAALSQDYGAILMDCQMPGLDGFEATKQIRASTGGASTVPIIAVTASVMPGDRQRASEAGMDGFVAKPIRIPQLAAALERRRRYSKRRHSSMFPVLTSDASETDGAP